MSFFANLVAQAQTQLGPQVGEPELSVGPPPYSTPRSFFFFFSRKEREGKIRNAFRNIRLLDLLKITSKQNKQGSGFLFSLADLNLSCRHRP
jgi:hypothetical protein